MSKKIISLGLMSGTSVDGLDLALCSFTKKNKIYSYKTLKTQTIKYTSAWKKKLANAQKLNAKNFFELHNSYGIFLGECVNKFLLDEIKKPTVISSHGHTVFHDPKNGFSVQIGNGATIAATACVTTVSDFRSLDVALGGQGAPLVPIGDKLLFSQYESCLNLGGISNISFLKNKLHVAFDICAVNMVLNFLSEKLGKSMDEGGKIAARGKVNTLLLKNLNNNPYYLLKNQKSIGREWVEENIFSLNQFKQNSKKESNIIASKIKTEDLIATYTEHIAIQISEVLNKNKLKNVLITGGGAYNKYLIKRINFFSKTKLILPKSELINFKEAIIFGLLGALRTKEEINTLKSVTGAKKDSSGGSVYYFKAK